MQQVRRKISDTFNDNEQSTTDLLELCKRNKDAVFSYPVFKFWEEALKRLIIGVRDDDTTFIQIFGVTVVTKENILTKSMQLSENSEILIVVNLKNKESKSKDTKKSNLDETRGVDDISKVDYYYVDF